MCIQCNAYIDNFKLHDSTATNVFKFTVYVIFALLLNATPFQKQLDTLCVILNKRFHQACVGDLGRRHIHLGRSIPPQHNLKSTGGVYSARSLVRFKAT